MDREGITLFHGVPTLAQVWLGTRNPGTVVRTLRWAFLAGEPLTDVLVERWRDAMPPTGKVVNLYGPTETTLVKCFHVVAEKPRHGIQPLGTPLPQTQALILNADCQLCGVGEPGEIAIRTPFRTFGYINAPQEQLKRFVRNPFSDDPDDLIYRTGDRGRYRVDGTLEFLGRIDDQVKIRGVRIEPAEVTAILARHPKIKACFVTPAMNPQQETILVCYAMGADGPVTRNDLRSYLAQELPAAMVPSEFVFLNALPLTANGKIDRKALPPPDFLSAAIRPDFIPPRTPVECVLGRIWGRALNLHEVGVHDNFFNLGGHSLVATQVVSQIRRELRVELPLQTIFAKPTIESLALHVLEARASGSEDIEELLAGLEALSDERAEHEVLNLELEGRSKHPRGEAQS
jgi:hypothetical protein